MSTWPTVRDARRTTRAAKALALGLVGLGAWLVACSSDSNDTFPGCLTSTPAGSYAQTCESCSMSGTVLTCTCRGGANGAQVTRLDTCSCDSASASNDLSNDKGVLKCGSASSGPAGPEKCSPKSGECKNNGDCRCGQTCFASAVCSTCSKRCGYSCSNNEECSGLKAELNLTVGYSRCTKTSPSAEIYRCE
ncbi:MAG: hypothetical protein KF764_15015 [Labilithrix sp.]|nr:hypothetical protein [Labilithrix sp.]MBX3222499.1 hypothetical protein [Labilithrix sp.]